MSHSSWPFENLPFPTRATLTNPPKASHKCPTCGEEDVILIMLNEVKDREHKLEHDRAAFEKRAEALNNAIRQDRLRQQGDQRDFERQRLEVLEMLQGDRDAARRERDLYRQLVNEQAETRRVLLGLRDALQTAGNALVENEAELHQAEEALRLEREAFEQEKQAAAVVKEGAGKRRWWKWLSRK